MLQTSEKTEFLRNGKNVLLETLAKASEDPVFNLKIGNFDVSSILLLCFYNLVIACFYISRSCAKWFMGYYF